MAAFYGVQPSPVDDSIWGQAMDVGFSRIDQPGYLMRLVPGPNPSETALAELFCRRMRVTARAASTSTTNGVVWTVLSSGHMASFDRKKCKGPLNGPAAATGKHCPEGWTLYQFPGPQFKGVTDTGSAEPRLLHLGRSLQHARPRRQRADRLGQRRRVAARGRGRQVREPARALSAWASSPRTSTAASTIRTPAGRARPVDHVGHAHRVPQRRRHERAAQGLQAADTPRSAGALTEPVA